MRRWKRVKAVKRVKRVDSRQDGAPVRGPSRFLNRELSWLEFNDRVLEEACDPAVPLAERLKFQGIVCSNLDEFFMVRVAGLKELAEAEPETVEADAMLPAQQLAQISAHVHAMVERLYVNWRKEIEPRLAREAGITLVRPSQLGAGEQALLHRRFSSEVWPVLTPLAVDQGHPFPLLRNRSLNLGILLRDARAKKRTISFAVVQVPAMLGRLWDVPATPGQRAAFILLEDLIAMHAGEVFPGFEVLACTAFRVLRNSDLVIDADDADNLLTSVQRELRRRERGQPVRLEIAQDAPPRTRKLLMKALHLGPEDVYAVNGPLHLTDLVSLYDSPGLARFKDEPFSPQPARELQSADLFEAITRKDRLLYHPYESFDHVVEFIEQAALDPKVLAIKQTLYRTSAASPVVRALIHAAENGKQVTAIIELRARFDEAPNIAWARVLEQAGVHVVYGVVGLKTHCKVALVARREDGKIRRYVHLSTGNYHPATARIYGDISYFTVREAFADDAGSLFNMLTGYSAQPSWQRFSVAPLDLRERVIALIERERGFGARGRIIAKMNSLVDPDVIRALYRASRAGVRIDLLVRGICCLRPGLRGISQNISVASVVDRFLEHARVFYFGAGGANEVYLSSADWMPRNFDRRVEVMFPIEDESLRVRLIGEILQLSLADNVKARRLLLDGRYERVRPKPGEPLVRSQQKFMELARARAQSRPAGAERGAVVAARS